MFERLEEEESPIVPSASVGFYIPRTRAFLFVVLVSCVFLVLVILAIILAIEKPKGRARGECQLRSRQIRLRETGTLLV